MPQEGLVPPVGMVPPGGTVSPGLPQMSEEGAGSDDAAGQNGLAEHYDEDVYQQGEFVEVCDSFILQSNTKTFIQTFITNL